MTPHLGFRTIGYRRLSPEEAISRIALAGYDGVELCLEHPGLEPERLDAQRCRRLAELAREVGTRIATVSYHGDRDPLEMRWPRALRAVELVPHFGCTVLIINSPRPGAGAPPDLEAQLHDHLGQQIERAEALGVTLALEPEPGLVIHGVREMMALMERFPSPALGVNLDVGHAELTEDDVPGAIRRLGSAIVAAHIEDIAGGVHQHLVPGTGEMDLAAIIGALREIDFGGWMTVDLFDIADAPDEAARASLRAMRRLLGG
ncbi:MAG: sugar phosphate isomerase/epimerase family protein [Armatimonadota bacterium]